jgi:hypothetical protein
LLSDTFVATVVGAAIAGSIGILTLFVQQELERLRRLNEDVLGPALNYVLSLPTVCPLVGLTDPLWMDLDSYHWLRIPTRFRLPMGVLSTSLAAYRAAWTRYFDFMGSGATVSFQASVQSAVKPYLSNDVTAIRAADLGLEGGAVIQVQWIVSGVVPYISVDSTNPARAWEQLEVENLSSFYWTRQVVSALKKKDPATLSRLFEAVAGNPELVRAREMVLAMRSSYVPVVAQRNVLRGLLGSRLGLRRSLKTVRSTPVNL